MMQLLQQDFAVQKQAQRAYDDRLAGNITEDVDEEVAGVAAGTGGREAGDQSPEGQRRLVVHRVTDSRTREKRP